MVGKMLDLNPKFCRTFTIFRNNMTILENLYHYTTKWLDSDIRFTIYYIFYILFPDSCKNGCSKLSHKKI